MSRWNRLATARVSLVRVFLMSALVSAGVGAGYGFSVVRAQGEVSTISACVNTWNGAVRIVDDGDNCSRSEYTESWAKQGASGIAGYEIVTARHDIDFVVTAQRVLLCPSGKVALAGSSFISGSELTLQGDHPVAPGSVTSTAIGWIFSYQSSTGSGGSGTVDLSVTCVKAPVV